MTDKPAMKKYRITWDYDSGSRVVSGAKTDYGHTADVVLKRVKNDMRQKFKNARNFEIRLV